MNTQKKLTRREAAEHLAACGYPIAVATLNKYATTGGGPRFLKFGRRVLYVVADLETWAESKTRASDTPPLPPASWRDRLRTPSNNKGV